MRRDIMISKAINFIKRDIWRIQLRKTSRKRSFLVKNLRIVLLALRRFNEDKCQLRASALTFYSILSIVPVAAMAFGIAKGFGFEKTLQTSLMERLPGQEEVVGHIVNFAQTLLDNTKGGLIAGIGVGVLFWTIIKVLGNIEKSFNDIWGIKHPRSFARKISDYLSIMLICPVLFIASSSLTVVIASQVRLVIEKISFLGAFGPLIFFLLKLLPYCVIWILFSFIYIFMPNTKVKFKSAILAGIVAGSIYQIVQWLYVNFQIGMAKYNAIYGSFAALPLFLMWVQISWLVVLLGAEISFAHQNVETYEFEHDCLRISYSFKRLLTLRIAQVLVKNFASGERPLSADNISSMLEIPVRLVNQILYELSEAGIVLEAKEEDNKDTLYMPARDIENFTVKSVIDSLEGHGSNDIPVVESNELKRISTCLKAFSEAIEKSSCNVALKDI